MRDELDDVLDEAGDPPRLDERLDQIEEQLAELFRGIRLLIWIVVGFGVDVVWRFGVR